MDKEKYDGRESLSDYVEESGIKTFYKRLNPKKAGAILGAASLTMSAATIGAAAGIVDAFKDLSDGKFPVIWDNYKDSDKTYNNDNITDNDDNLLTPQYNHTFNETDIENDLEPIYNEVNLKNADTNEIYTLDEFFDYIEDSEKPSYLEGESYETDPMTKKFITKEGQMVRIFYETGEDGNKIVITTGGNAIVRKFDYNTLKKMPQLSKLSEDILKDISIYGISHNSNDISKSNIEYKEVYPGEVRECLYNEILEAGNRTHMRDDNKFFPRWDGLLQKNIHAAQRSGSWSFIGTAPEGTPDEALDALDEVMKDLTSSSGSGDGPMAASKDSGSSGGSAGGHTGGGGVTN